MREQQTQPTNSSARAFETDAVSLDSRFRWWGEYLPFQDVDDIRLAIMAGCYTANEDDIFGQFAEIGKRRGIDSIVGFTGLVYYPATTAGTPVSETNYSGNYFWARFSAYVKNGDTVATALGKARTDLVAKEGNAGGWQNYRIGGSIASPGSVRMHPQGSGTPLTSQPLGLAPYSLSSLEVTQTSTGTSPLGDTTESSTTEGVSFRRLDSTGQLLDIIAPASTAGVETLSLDGAQRAALDFVASESSPINNGWRLTRDAALGRTDGEALASFEWRRLTSAGDPGPESLSVEIDRRTGAVTYFSRVSSAGSGSAFALTEASALAITRSEVDTTNADVSAVRDVWERSRWIATVDRGLDGLVPDVDRLIIDGTTGEVLYDTTT